MKSAMHRIAPALLGVLLTTCSTLAGAQAYPVRPIRVIVPFAPGGATDAVVRMIAPRLSENLGQQVVVDRATGQVKVERVTAAADAGQIINPDGLTNQLEGGVIQAVSWTLKERVRFDRARVTTRNWDDYPILTFEEAPSVEVVLLDRPHEPSLGVGEGMMGPTAAAIGNAVFNAMGVRVRDLPLTRERIIAASA